MGDVITLPTALSKAINLQALTRTAAERLMFKRLFDLLIDADPKVPFDDVDGFFAEMFDSIEKGRAFQYGRMWSIAMQEIARSRSKKIGANIVMLFGSLSDIATRPGQPLIDMQHLLVLMAHMQPKEVSFVRFDCPQGKKKHRLYVTDEGIRGAGISGFVMLDDQVPTFDTADEFIEKTYDRYSAIF